MTRGDDPDNRFDFLRLLAAWLVLLSHAYALAGGQGSDPVAKWIGVDTAGGVGVGIFFALSGYLVAISLERSASVLDFARRRALRIYPALISVCLFCVLVVGPALTTWAWLDYFTHAATWDYMLNATGFQTRYPLPGVFATNPVAQAVNGSLWSLPYELRCYCALVVIGLLPGGMRAKSLLAALGLLAVMLARPQGVNGADMPVFSPHGGFDMYDGKLSFIFAIGVVVASWRASITSWHWRGAGVAAAGALAYAIWFASSQAKVPLFCAALAVGALTLALHGQFLPRIPAAMGDWSYGTYLYGFVVQQMLVVAGVHQQGIGIYLAASTALTFCAAAISWHTIEKPAIRYKTSRAVA